MMSDLILWRALLVLLVLAMSALLLLPGVREWRQGRSRPLVIPADDEAGIDYFGQRMRGHLARDWGGTEAAPVPDLRRQPPPEGYFVLGTDGRVRGDVATERQASKTIVGNAISVDPGVSIMGDVYASQALSTGPGCVVRAVLADGPVVLGDGSSLLRWADAEKLECGRDCRLLGRVSARESIALGHGTIFGRLAAPRIEFGPADAGEFAVPSGKATPSNIGELLGERLEEAFSQQGRWVCRGDLEVPDGTLVTGHLIVHGRLYLGEDCEVVGSVKCHKGAEIGARARIHGSIFAGGPVALGEGSEIEGMVSSERAVTCERHARIGSLEHPASLIAPVLSVAAGAVVYGSAWASREGQVV